LAILERLEQWGWPTPGTLFRSSFHATGCSVQGEVLWDMEEVCGASSGS
jgi:hypothetical protein